MEQVSKMLEITIKIKGEQGSGKSNTVKNLITFLKACPHEYVAQVWTKQPLSPIWTRELLMKSEDQIIDRSEIVSEQEPN